MHTLKERLQILVSTEQKRRLQAEAQTRGESVGGLVREAIDERYGKRKYIAAKDRVHVATCLEHGIEQIVTADKGFDAVAGLQRIDPRAGAAPLHEEPI